MTVKYRRLKDLVLLAASINKVTWLLKSSDSRQLNSGNKSSHNLVMDLGYEQETQTSFVLSTGNIQEISSAE